jgi:ferredoxin-NADP reductase/predicted pyridoxine 5'-phosphate oxidase superfamily flavin-nucleotide-binding protein
MSGATRSDEAAASPFHEGERAIQSELGVRNSIEAFARRVVRPYMPDEHIAFYGQLPFVAAAARDARGRPWATLLAGEPGFMSSPDSRTLRIDARPGPGDPLRDTFVGAAGEEPPAETPDFANAFSDVGLLGIEFDTRRRNRVNGRIASRADASEATIFEVEQSFGNCPQYIHPRAWKRASIDETADVTTRSTTVTERQRRQIESADTFFIATGHRGEGQNPAFGMDASHRGGAPGFVEVEGDGAGTLTFPDFAGNNHFNTLGNLACDARAGLLFVDFESGGLLQLTGRAEVDWAEPDVSRYPGARRLIRFHVEEIVEQRSVLPIRWAEPLAEVRELIVTERREESADVTSFALADPSGRRLPAWKAGQHLPLEVEAGPGGARIGRTYSLSNDPESGVYRISVKREDNGVVSGHLHQDVQPGTKLYARRPAGDFHLSDHAAEERGDASPDEHDSADSPLLLVAAGVGITPIASMLHAIRRHAPQRRVTVVHGVRDGQHQPLTGELRRVVEALPNARLHVCFSQPRSADRAGVDFETSGRIDISVLRDLERSSDTEVFLCGPPAFANDVSEMLEALGTPVDRIHFETF